MKTKEDGVGEVSVHATNAVIHALYRYLMKGILDIPLTSLYVIYWDKYKVCFNVYFIFEFRDKQVSELCERFCNGD